jgi:hypothetical protein
MVSTISSVSAQEYQGNSNNSGLSYGLLFIFILFLVGIGFLIRRRGHERRYFNSETKRYILKKQGRRCANCNWNAGVFDFDHKDGNRSNNKVSNCQALCPNCHAKKSRGLIDVRKKSKFSIKVAAFLFFFFIFLAIIFSYGPK